MPVVQSIFVFDPFSFDPVNGELKRNGQKIRVPEQSCRLLTVLLKHAGDVVTRETLRHSLWTEGEYLNHDHSISNAINQLRTILRDRPSAPVYIETVPKRGYRFMAPVSCISPEKPPSVAPLAAPTVEPAETPPPLSIQSSRVGWRGLSIAGLALLALAAGVLLHRKNAKPPPPAYTAMGIAPFEASGPGAQQLADGLRLDLTDSLSQLPRIQVRAAHSFTSADRDDASVRKVAQDLQLDVLLFGRLNIAEDKGDLQLELVRGRDAVHLGAFHYTFAKGELGSIRDRIQSDIFARLEASPLNGRKAPGGTDNPKAYEAYLESRAKLLLWKDEPIATVLEGFQTAATLDPAFARAYAEMASVYVIAAEHSLAPRDQSYHQAEQLAAKAIALDPSQAEAHAALGFIHFRRDWDAQSAERELREAVSLEPNQAIHHVMLALLLGNTGRFKESLYQVDLAHEDDAQWPPVYLTEMYLASSAHLNKRALDSAEKLVQLRPDWPLALDQRAWALWYAGRSEDAIDAWRSMALVEKDGARVALEDEGRKAFLQGGIPAYARTRLTAIHSGRNWAHPNDFEPAEWYLNARDQKQALAAIKQMVDSHDPEALQLAVSPAYTRLHDNPEFRSLLTRVGLTLPSS